MPLRTDRLNQIIAIVIAFLMGMVIAVFLLQEIIEQNTQRKYKRLYQTQKEAQWTPSK